MKIQNIEVKIEVPEVGDLIVKNNKFYVVKNIFKRNNDVFFNIISFDNGLKKDNFVNFEDIVNNYDIIPQDKIDEFLSEEGTDIINYIRKLLLLLTGSYEGRIRLLKGKYKNNEYTIDKIEEDGSVIFAGKLYKPFSYDIIEIHKKHMVDSGFYVCLSDNCRTNFDKGRIYMFRMEKQENSPLYKVFICSPDNLIREQVTLETGTLTELFNKLKSEFLYLNEKDMTILFKNKEEN